MFNQLIESNSHKKELKRRGSFLVYTTLTYVMLFALTGVASIRAYDSHIEQQSVDISVVMRPDEIMMPTEEVIACGPQIHHEASHTAGSGSDKPQTTTSVNHPQAVPDGISTEAVRGVALPPGPSKGDYRSITNSGEESGFSDRYQGSIVKHAIEVLPDEPPPAPKPTPVKIVKATTIVNGLATFLPKPNYPAIAKQIHTQGSVNVQVLIDETGRVISARAVSGHPFLVPESVRAATNARFTPTLLNGQAVKLSGVIVYNFIMQ